MVSAHVCPLTVRLPARSNRIWMCFLGDRQIIVFWKALPDTWALRWPLQSLSWVSVAQAIFQFRGVWLAWDVVVTSSEVTWALGCINPCPATSVQGTPDASRTHKTLLTRAVKLPVHTAPHSFFSHPHVCRSGWRDHVGALALLSFGCTNVLMAKNNLDPAESFKELTFSPLSCCLNTFSLPCLHSIMAHCGDPEFLL